MKTSNKSMATLLLCLMAGQMVAAGPLGVVIAAKAADDVVKGAVLGGAGVLVTGAATAVQTGAKIADEVVKGTAQVAGQALATGVKVVQQVDAANRAVVGSVVNTVDTHINRAINDAADFVGLDWNAGLVKVDNFKVNGKCSGNGYCFPKFNSAQISDPTLTCGAGFTAQLTVPKAGELLCTKNTDVTQTLCFRSFKCPAISKQAGKDCLDLNIAKTLAGVLAVFSSKAILPLDILPGLAVAIKKAVLLKPLLPIKAALALPATGLKLALHGVDTIKSLVAAALGVEVASVLSNPIEDLAKGLLSLNVTTELVPVLPQLELFVSEHLKGLAQLPETLVSEALKMIPTCLAKCCSDLTETVVETQAPKIACPAGMKFDALSLMCTGAKSGYDACPSGMTMCSGKIDMRPVCVAQKKVWGMDSCSVVSAMGVAGGVPKVACP